MSPVAGGSTPTPRNAEESVRAFFAVWPDASANDALALLARATAREAQGRAPPQGNLHLTLAFLGEVAVARVTALHAIGAAAASMLAPFPLTLDCMGIFRGPGIAWAGASAPPREIGVLVRRLRDALEADGFAIERRAFQPHVTLARHCGKPLAKIRIAAPIVWIVSRIVLNASETGPAGPRYRELASWALRPTIADPPIG